MHHVFIIQRVFSRIDKWKLSSAYPTSVPSITCRVILVMQTIRAQKTNSIQVTKSRVERNRFPGSYYTSLLLWSHHCLGARRDKIYEWILVWRTFRRHACLLPMYNPCRDGRDCSFRWLLVCFAFESVSIHLDLSQAVVLNFSDQASSSHLLTHHNQPAGDRRVAFLVSYRCIIPSATWQLACFL